MTWRDHVVHGVGCVLPGQVSACNTWEELASTLLTGGCRLSPFRHESSRIGVAGQVPSYEVQELDLSPRRLSKLPRVSIFAHLAVQRSCHAANLTPEALSRARSLLIVCSVQFGLRELPELLNRVSTSPEDVGLDYWISGTPGSLASCLSTNLGLEMPTLTLTGGCSASLRAYHLATTLLMADELDYVVVVGADCVLEPVFLSSTGRQGRSGFQASTMSDSPSAVRPHDETQTGNAPGEGAVCVVLGRPGTPGSNRFRVTSAGASTRRLGVSPVGLGDPDAFARDMRDLLAAHDVPPSGLHHVGDFAEGGRALEDFCVDAFQALARGTECMRDVPLTSHEACFGHIPGVAGLLKVLAALHQLESGTVAPTANLQQPYHRWEGWTLVPADSRPLERPGSTALVVATSGGGDTSSMLLRHSV